MPERPGQALGGGEPVAEGDVARPHQPGGERQRHEREEPEVDGGQHVRGPAGAEDLVQDRGGLVAEEQRPVHEVQLAVVLAVAHDEGQERLEVPVADVGDVEADEAHHDQRHPLAGPVVAHPLARDARHQLGVEARDPQRPRQHVEEERAEHQHRQAQPRGPEEPFGVDEGPVQRHRCEDGEQTHDSGDSHEERVGRAIHAGQSRDDRRNRPDRESGDRRHAGRVDAQAHRLARARRGCPATRPRRARPARRRSTTRRTSSGVARAETTVPTSSPSPATSAERRSATLGASGRPAAARSRRAGTPTSTRA